MEKYVVILACGNGTRMGSDVPKQYLLLNNKPIVFCTIERIHAIDNTCNIIVVINKEHTELFNDLKRRYALNVPFQLVFGGEERYFSVKNALDTIVNDNSLVALHDGVRPLVDKAMLDRGFEDAERYGNAVCAVKVTDSVRKGDENSNVAIDRNEVFLVQTPQTFLTYKIKQAYLQPFESKFTDDASVLEKMGEKIHIIEGKRENIKITYPMDLIVVQQLMKNSSCR